MFAIRCERVGLGRFLSETAALRAKKIEWAPDQRRSQQRPQPKRAGNYENAAPPTFTIPRDMGILKGSSPCSGEADVLVWPEI